VLLVAHHTPGHTRGATTWERALVDNGRAYNVVWPGGGFNPGYRVGKDSTSCPGINADYRRTHHLHEMLKPEILLGAYAEWFGYPQKRDRGRVDGVQAWVNPEEYRQFVAKPKREFEDQVDLELGVKNLVSRYRGFPLVTLNASTYSPPPVILPIPGKSHYPRVANLRPRSPTARRRRMSISYPSMSTRTMKDRDNARVVYSSAAGRICRRCGLPDRGCRCGQATSEPVPVRPVAKLRMEKAGRGGKTVTVVFGLPNNTAFLKDLCQDLKRACGTGGAATADGVELQGDLRERVRELLISKGFGVKG
jgi:predicted translation initiation factor SUI1